MIGKIKVLVSHWDKTLQGPKFCEFSILVRLAMGPVYLTKLLYGKSQYKKETSVT